MNILISGTAPILYPIETLFGVIYCDNNVVLEIPYKYPLYGQWGYSVSKVFREPQDINVLRKIDIVYLSIIEKKVLFFRERTI